MSKSREWIVPLQITVQTQCIVDAETPQEAVEKATRHEWAEDFRSQAEAIDWEVTGSAVLNE